MSKVRHVLGISGGKDSAALAIYLKKNYPELYFEYYFCDTHKELDETYELIEKLESELDQEIKQLISDEARKANQNPFDYFYDAYRGYLPSSVARWCTKKMKLEPFEKYVGDDPVISYVGIRGDEDREGYISKKSNIQSIFPFRRNIWSEDVIKKVLDNEKIDQLADYYQSWLNGAELDRALKVVLNPMRLEPGNPAQNKIALHKKLNQLLDQNVIAFNKVVFDYLKTTSYPLARVKDFPLLENEDVLVRDDIFRILKESGVGVPEYYEKVEYEVNGEKGEYARSRSGCYFCFYQQKIEWIWLYEQHPNLFQKAMEYENEKEGFTWNQNESLKDLIEPKRMEQIKWDHIKRSNKEKSKDSNYLIDVLDDTEDVGCTACFI